MLATRDNHNFRDFFFNTLRGEKIPQRNRTGYVWIKNDIDVSNYTSNLIQNKLLDLFLHITSIFIFFTKHPVIIVCQ